jgi:SH3-like domain-containing protein
MDTYVPVEQNLSFEPEPAYITGNQQGSRVNVRTGPGARFDANAYGLVGDAVQVIGQAFSNDCETWFRVRFPISGHIGWIHGDFIRHHYARGWWD